jgi:hypothetical protein
MPESSRDYTVEKMSTAESAIRRNSYNLSVPVGDYLATLIQWGGELITAGTDGECCEVCNKKLAFWWQQVNALSIPERVFVQQQLRASTGTLPEGPWESVN